MNKKYTYSIYKPLVVKMQTVENYHNDKNKDYWKFKGYSTYVVYDCKKAADAIAFIIEATASKSKRDYKNFPIDWLPLDDYLVELGKEEQIDRDIYLDSLICLSPDDYKHTKNGKEYTDCDIAKKSIYKTFYNNLEEVSNV